MALDNAVNRATLPGRAGNPASSHDDWSSGVVSTAQSFELVETDELAESDDSEPAEAMLPLLDWIAQQSDYKERTVRRYLAEGRIPAARRDATGRWYLPAGAQVVPRELALVEPAAAPDPLGRPWWSLDELGQLLGLSVHNLRAMAAAGQLATTKGPHGRTIVWRGELIRLLGPGR